MYRLDTFCQARETNECMLNYFYDKEADVFYWRAMPCDAALRSRLTSRLPSPQLGLTAVFGMSETGMGSRRKAGAAWLRGG